MKILRTGDVGLKFGLTGTRIRQICDKYNIGHVRFKGDQRALSPRDVERIAGILRRTGRRPEKALDALATGK